MSALNTSSHQNCWLNGATEGLSRANSFVKLDELRQGYRNDDVIVLKRKRVDASAVFKVRDQLGKPQRVETNFEETQIFVKIGTRFSFLLQNPDHLLKDDAVHIHVAAYGTSSVKKRSLKYFKRLQTPGAFLGVPAMTTTDKSPSRERSGCVVTHLQPRLAA